MVVGRRSRSRSTLFANYFFRVSRLKCFNQDLVLVVLAKFLCIGQVYDVDYFCHICVILLVVNS